MSETTKTTANKPETIRKNPALMARKEGLSKTGSSPHDRILQLQRTIGNREVQRLIQSGALQAKLTIGAPNDKYEQEADRVADKVMSMPEPRKTATNNQSSINSSPGAIARQEETEEEPLQTKPIVEQITPLVQRQPEEEEPLQTKSIQRQEAEEEEEPIQPKLIQRQVETEEEEVQTKIQRQPEEEEEPIQPKLIQRQENEEEEVQAKLQRQPEEEEPVQAMQIQRQESEEEEVQTKLQRQSEEEEEPVQAKSSSNQSQTASPTVESGINSLKGGGQPLSESTRSYFEPRFGTDFSQVRLHTDSKAADTAKSINAKAFTTGKDIAFGSNQYSPETSPGKHLLAHELTHTIQQSSVLRRRENLFKNTNHSSITCSSSSKSNIHRDSETLTNIQKLDEMLDRINVPEEEVIKLLGELSPAEKKTVLTGRYKFKIAKTLNIEEMVRAVNILNPPLHVKLSWVEAAAFRISSIDYSDIQSMITSKETQQKERDAMDTVPWRNFFVKLCDNDSMKEAVNDLGFDVVTQLDWMFEEGTNWDSIEPIIDVISLTDFDSYLTQLYELGRLDDLLDEWPESKYIKVDKFYYITKDPTLKKKIEKYYKVPKEQVKGMKLIHKAGRDIKYPGHDIVDPDDPTRKIYDAAVEKESGYLNKEFWVKIYPMTFRLKSGEKASTAIEKIFEGPTRLECLSMIRAIHFRTILQTLGAEEFDKRFNSTNFIITTLSSRIVQTLAPYTKKVAPITESEKESKIQKGDWVYFKNHPKYFCKHPGGAWSGENAICMGKNILGENIYRGFGVPKLTDDRMCKKLQEAYDKSRTDEERMWLVEVINSHFPRAFPLDAIPSDSQLDAWISSNLDFLISLFIPWMIKDFHTTKFPDKAPIADIEGLSLDMVYRIKL